LTGCRCPPGFQGDGHKCVGKKISLVLNLSHAANLITEPIELSDLDECKERLACTCPDCQCKNTWGNYECRCKGSQLYIRGEDVCIGKRRIAGARDTALRSILCLHSTASDQHFCWTCRAANNMSKLGWFITILVVSCVAGVAVAGYVFYKYRLRVSSSASESEIHVVMQKDLYV
jgi:hypothetical protein